MDARFGSDASDDLSERTAGWVLDWPNDSCKSIGNASDCNANLNGVRLDRLGDSGVPDHQKTKGKSPKSVMDQNDARNRSHLYRARSSLS